MSLQWLDENNLDFPPIEEALTEPDGLLALGGDLCPDRLIQAYSRGIFPWYSDDQPILWWSPDPRMVLRPENLKISRSLSKLLRRDLFELTLDKDFPLVISCCAQQRDEATGTWITDEMRDAYIELHHLGYAHSVEVWSKSDKSLLGGLYGVAIGKVFFGESMFSKADNSSKVALVYLVEQLRRWGFQLIDCQVTSNHLISLGAVELGRLEFAEEISSLVDQDGSIGPWSFDEDLSFAKKLLKLEC